MAFQRLTKCRHCGRKFRPSCFNRHRQEWCAAAECRRARDRLRRRRYLDGKSDDPAFRAAERARSRAGMKRFRARCGEEARAENTVAAPVPLPSAPGLGSPALEQVLIGLVSQLADTDDPGELSRHFASYADRGRHVAILNHSRDFQQPKIFFHVTGRSL